MRGRIWIFAALVAVALALHLVALSAKVAQTGEDNVRAHLALSTSALRAQLDLLDARLSPRAVASAPDLVEATRAPADPAEPLPRPADRALRAAASVLSPEPDLVAVATRQGAILSRRARAAQPLDDAGQLPLAKAALEGNPPTAFASFDGAVYRLAAARVPGNGAAVVLGTLIDDRFAAQLKSQVDADVTLLQGGKVLASSLAQGEPRTRVVRWAAAPSPGYGVLPVILPGIGDALTGKLPQGANRYAVRAALVSIDSGVQAALTVPAGPYLGWLGRYQAFYLVALGLFLLFSLVWGLLARTPRPPPADRTPQSAPGTGGETEAEPPARKTAPALLGTDVGEARAEPPPAGDVPWPAAEPPEPATKSPPPPVMLESLDPDLPAPVEPEPEMKVGKVDAPEPSVNAPEHPMWSADPFTPTPAHVEPQMMSAEEAGLVEAEPAKAPAPPPDDLHGDEQQPAAPHKDDFSFAGLLDEAQRAHAAAPRGEAQAPEAPETASPAAPAEEGPPPRAEGKEPEAPFPGDEPTRIEPVSAALLDKLRERDEELTAQAAAAAVPAPPEANVTMQDFSMPAVESADPDEPHWRETYERFRDLKAKLGEPTDRITFDKFAAKLRKNRADLLAKHNCKGVRFSVYERDGKAAIKASAIR